MSTFAPILVCMMTGCASMHFPAVSHHKNPYEGKIFYTKYLNPQASGLDAQIQHDLDLLRANPRAASVHNDLGAALLVKGFPKDAEVEFERAVDADRRFYPAWYNLGLVRAARGDAPRSGDRLKARGVSPGKSRETVLSPEGAAENSQASRAAP